jgi:hypothetical protein
MSLAAIASSAIGNVKNELGGDKKHQVKLSETIYSNMLPNY